jgi:peroxiredoxin
VAHDPYELPADLPVPVDDGACDHLPGMNLPDISLPSTSGGTVAIGALSGTNIFYVYPRTGRPGVRLHESWDQIPGARGCTPQSCAFRDAHDEIRGLGAEIFGISSQTTTDQREFVERAHIPFELLSDPAFELAGGIRLPTFEVDAHTYYKRVTLIVDDGLVVKLFYPVFPPDRNADDVLAWLRSDRGHMSS